MPELTFSHFGENRQVNATQQELEIFNILCDMSGISLELVRRSDSYVTAAIGDCDIARFKFTDRAKWIMFPYVERGSTKNRISTANDIKAFQDKLSESLELYEKYK